MPCALSMAMKYAFSASCGCPSRSSAMPSCRRGTNIRGASASPCPKLAIAPRMSSAAICVAASWTHAAGSSGANRVTACRPRMAAACSPRAHWQSATKRSASTSCGCRCSRLRNDFSAAPRSPRSACCRAIVRQASGVSSRASFMGGPLPRGDGMDDPILASVDIAESLYDRPQCRQHRLERVAIGMPAIDCPAADALGHLGVAGRADVALAARMLGKPRHGRCVLDAEEFAEFGNAALETADHRFVTPLQQARRENLHVLLPLLEGLDV